MHQQLNHLQLRFRYIKHHQFFHIRVYGEQVVVNIIKLAHTLVKSRWDDGTCKCGYQYPNDICIGHECINNSCKKE